MTYKYVQSATDLGPAKGPRLAFVWHMAEGGGTVAFLAKPNPNDVSVHFVVEYSGTIVQMLPLEHMHSSLRTTAIRGTDDAPYQYRGEMITYGATAARHIMGRWADVRDSLGPNHASIAAEVEGFAATGPNDAQTAAIAALARDLGLPALGHRDFQSYKACPGHQFPWFIIGGHAQGESDNVEALQGRRIADAASGHGIFTEPTADASLLVRNTVPGELVRPQAMSTPHGWYFVEATTGPFVRGWIKDDWLTNWRNEPDPVPADCSAWETWYELAPKP